MRLRLLGLLIGSLVAVLCVGGAAIYDAAFEASIVTVVALPIMVSGAVGGWLMAPQARRPHDPWGWAGIVLALGLLGVVIGDVTVVATFILVDPFGPSAWTVAPTDLTVLLSELAAAAWLAIVGAALYGWLALICTVPAAMVWAAVMRFTTARWGFVR